MEDAVHVVWHDHEVIHPHMWEVAWNASQSSCAINPAALRRTMPDLISPNSGARAFAQIVTKYAPR